MDSPLKVSGWGLRCSGCSVRKGRKEFILTGIWGKSVRREMSVWRIPKPDTACGRRSTSDASKTGASKTGASKPSVHGGQCFSKRSETGSFSLRSNGSAGGQVHRLKMIQCSIFGCARFGRARFDLLLWRSTNADRNPIPQSHDETWVLQQM